MTNVPEDLYLPVLWFEGVGLMDENSASIIKQLFDLPQITNFVGLAICILCTLGAIISLYLGQFSKLDTTKLPKNHPLEMLPMKDHPEEICDMKLFHSAPIIQIQAEK